MTASELIDHLQALDDRLRSSEVQAFVLTQGAEERAAFVARRRQLQEQLGKIRNARLQEVDDALSAAEADLKAAVDDAKGALNRLEAVDEVLAVLEKVATVVAAVLGGAVGLIL